MGQVPVVPTHPSRHQTGDLAYTAAGVVVRAGITVRCRLSFRAVPVGVLAPIQRAAAATWVRTARHQRQAATVPMPTRVAAAQAVAAVELPSQHRRTAALAVKAVLAAAVVVVGV